MQKISIITINYNNRDGLVKTINSVISQNYGFIEYIIIDGGSNDGSAEEIIKFKESGAFIHLECFKYCSERDNGIYDGMNKGVRLASGVYCLFLNSGDCFVNKNVLQLFFGNTNRTEDIIIGCQKHYNRFHLPCYRKLKTKQINKFFLLCDTFPHQCTFISLSLLNKVGGYHTDYRIVSDWIFWFEALTKYQAIVKTVGICVAEQQPDGISSNREECEKEINDYLSKNINSMSVGEWMNIRVAFSRYFLYQKATNSLFGKFLVRTAILFNKFFL